MASKKPSNAGKVAAVVSQAVVEKANSVSPPDIAVILSQLRDRIASTTAELEKSISEQKASLNNIQEAIALKKNELKELHNLEDIANQRNELLDEIEKLKAESENIDAMNQKKLEDAQHEQDEVIARKQKTADWEYEKKSRDRELQLQDKLSKIEMNHKLSFDAKNQELLTRENNIKLSEKELLSLREAVQNNELNTKAAVKAAEEEVEAALLKHFEYEKKNLEVEKKLAVELAEQKVRSANMEITRLENAMKAAETRVAEAEKTVRDISISVANAASGQMALAAVKDTIRQESTGGNKRS